MTDSAEGEGLPENETESITPLRKLDRDLRTAARFLSPDEARYMVDLYYTMQDQRIRADGQIRSASEDGEPNASLAWIAENMGSMEKAITRSMEAYAQASDVGSWSLSVCGIGPILAAGLCAHIDIEKAPTAGHIWRFAGMDPSVAWVGAEEAKRIVNEVMGSEKVVTQEHLDTIGRTLNRKPEYLEKIARWDIKKKELRKRISKERLRSVVAMPPWNARLKVLCWKIGESFVKVKGNESDVYGKVFEQRRIAEWSRNLNGELSAQAEDKLKRVRIAKATDAWPWYAGCYSREDASAYATALLARATPEKPTRGEPGSGVAMLPPGHIFSRSKRYAVKLFVAHWHHVAYVARFKRQPPKPYIIEHGGHVHFVAPPKRPA